MTRYREDALMVLDALRGLGGEASPREISEASGAEKTSGILRDNHYGWFTHPGRGIYGISPDGEAALKEYADALSVLRGEKKG